MSYDWVSYVFDGEAYSAQSNLQSDFCASNLLKRDLKNYSFVSIWE